MSFAAFWLIGHCFNYYCTKETCIFCLSFCCLSDHGLQAANTELELFRSGVNCSGCLGVSLLYISLGENTPPRKRRLYYTVHFLPCPKHLDLPSLERVAKKPWFSFSSTAWTQSVAVFCGLIFPWFEALCCLLSYLSLSSFCTNFLFLLLLSLILHRNKKCLAYMSKSSNGCADMPSNQSVYCHFCQ